MQTAMNGQSGNTDFFKSKVLGHPSGLFVLFFTEMWERFSFYGMRVLLINFLTMAAIGSNPGWAWTSENSGALFGTYAGLLYLTPIIGGIIADKYLGYNRAVIVGCIIMTLGHASMALETEFSLYAGLALLVIGTGFFKPNITSIIAQMYKDLPEKKDGAYTIFYMGVNAGAFFGMMLCGYLAEKIGWSWGFGLAGIFMLLGCLQFAMAKPLFGKIGDKPEPKKAEDLNVPAEKQEYKANPFTIFDKVLIVITSIIGLLYLLNDPLSKIGNVHLLPQAFLLSKDILSGPTVIIILGLILFLVLVVSRILRYDYVLRDRMFAVILFVFFTVFFVLSFEQGATSLVIFARDFTNRTFEGSAATAYIVVNTLLTVGPLVIITWVLFKLFKQTFKKISLSNIFLGLAFVGVWGLVIWMLNRDISSHAYEVSYEVVKSPSIDKEGNVAKDKTGKIIYEYTPVSEASILKKEGIVEQKKEAFSTLDVLKVGDKITLHEEAGKPVYLSPEQKAKIEQQYKGHDKPSTITSGTISQIKDSQVEITASWFSILNSFFIIVFASLVSKVWESKFNPSAPVKFGLGLIITAIGFAVLAYGAKAIPQGAEPGIVRVSMIWLIVAYLFHTLGELCIQPVGLSYVSKLVPGKMIAFMFGMWYLAIAIGNKLAGSLGGMIEEVTSKYDMSTFFLIFTFVPTAAGILLILLNPVIKKLMHGVK
ncbi:MFS transporter [Taibaiella sp. KBW10]|uniref:peptide MFS transporter n=1 Tax=Taibaiella sp. KBW10 TaxID=2153357 RepID=UPI000F5A1BC8|nr:peptide MFS transporter [Taibaiella sp. KBW10]RQO30239.1 MFS transporter [Taibaiella sp. KBW10]